MRRAHVVLLLALAFALRLAFGLCSELFGPDEVQTFLIGLQYFTTGQWPYLGPDVVYTHTQVPGALQGVLVGGPLFLVARPEAPYVVLNLISFGALCLLAWYIGRRLPGVPRWFLWPWVLFSPWTINYSTHLINTSYVMTGGIAFFVGACELTPRLRVGALSTAVASFLMGAGLLWIAQLHLSAALLGIVTLAIAALVAMDQPRTLLAGLPWFAAGAMLTGATLVPTLLHEGIGALAGSAGSTVTLRPEVLQSLPVLVARFFAFGSFEIARFLGAGTEERLAFLAAYPWAAPFVVVAGAIGVAQVALLAVGAVVPNPATRDWPAVRTALLTLLGLVCAAFALSVKGPASHAFYVVMPVVMIYSFYCWAPMLARPAGRRMAIVLLVSGAVTLLALGVRNYGLRSLYTNRPLVVRAIVEKNHRLVGERRPDEWRAGR